MGIKNMTTIVRGVGKVRIKGFAKFLSNSPNIDTPMGWNEFTFTGSDSMTSEITGYSVAISNDGNWLVMGAPGNANDDSQNLNRFWGAAYIFNWNGSDWIETQKLTNPLGNINSARYGYSVTINGDGSRIAIGATYDLVFPGGHVFVYDRTISTFSLSGTLTQSSPATSSTFGHAISMSLSGNNIAVGAPYHGISGAVYMFKFNGVSWVQEVIISGSATNNQSAFGFSVDIDDAGQRVVIGDPGSTFPNATGKAYTNIWTGTSWIEEAILSASDGTIKDRFGRAVSISGDSNYIIVGAPEKDNSPSDTDSGGAYIFKFQNPGWTEQQILEASAPAFELRYGYSVSLGPDGSRAAIGANSILGDNSILRGVYIVNRVINTWSEEIKLTPGAPFELIPSDYKQFGNAVSITDDGNRVAIGSPDVGIDEGSPSDLGRVHVFHYN